MNRQSIFFMTDEAIDTLKRNSTRVIEYIERNPDNSEWLKNIYEGKLYEEKKYKISEINLELSQNDDYKEVDYINSIRIYESLKELPRYVLSDERFWAWFIFEIAYKESLQAMKLKSEKTFLQHWLFSESNRRSLTFNVMARCFFRVELSVDETLENKYELTKFVIENPNRFRNLTWRGFSSNKKVVNATLKAEKAICEKYNRDFSGDEYAEVAKQLSLYASARLIDVVDTDDIYKFVYNKMEKLLI